eukprot:TRINITY_DN15880_c0_g1_i1.p1 TRINITY_DN15880_c0_g1~~TRINITY_DN15880_c0_g1_i1.p1  ORF type:complete len:56 (-),score=6.95 TRINITY_DN15880_c0_g1_i1:150-317(-)
MCFEGKGRNCNPNWCYSQIRVTEKIMNHQSHDYFHMPYNLDSWKGICSHLTGINP